MNRVDILSVVLNSLTVALVGSIISTDLTKVIGNYHVALVLVTGNRGINCPPCLFRRIPGMLITIPSFGN